LYEDFVERINDDKISLLPYAYLNEVCELYLGKDALEVSKTCDKVEIFNAIVGK
jgi:hypothetical protein